MQVPTPHAHDGVNDIETLSYERVPTPAVLHLVHADRLPAPTFYTRHGKRAIDLVGASVLLLILAIPMLVIATIVHLTSPGGPFFAQIRVGRGLSTFRCFKFRTMVRDADIVLMQNPQLKDAMAVSWKIPEDPRVTGIGRVLRKTSLDELPQLVNVLLGHMSLVGPRPVQVLEMEEMYGPRQFEVTSVRPGMTGLWQVSGRSTVSYDQRIAMDLKYVADCDFRSDVKLIIRTVGVVIGRTGAC